MQDGYYFATSPWMIGDGSQPNTGATSITMVEDTTGLRRGQIVRIAHEPEPEHEEGADIEIPSPMILRETDRYSAEPAAPEQQISSPANPDGETALPRLLAELSVRQDSAVARIEKMFSETVAQLEDRIVAGLAASMELARPQSAQSDRLDSTLATLAQDGATQADAMQGLGLAVETLTSKIDDLPGQNDALIRDVADIRAGLTELRVQARLIEMQLFAISRGTDNPLARPLGIEPLGTTLADTYAS